MKRIFNKGYDLVDPIVPVTPENPVPAYYFTNVYSEYERELAMPETSDPRVWNEWRSRLREKLRQVFTLDHWGLPPTPELVILKEEKCEGYTRKKVAYETMPGNWAVAYLLIPDGIKSPVPAVLCPHGHFRGAKEAVVKPELAAGVAYGHEFAKRGLVVLAPDIAGLSIPDHRGTNERDVPADYGVGQKETGCNLLFRRLQHMGLDITGFRVFELQVGLNLLSSLDEVDSGRIGCAGLSGGCWLSQVLAALDTRVKAVILSGYFTTFVQTAWLGHCVCHHPFGIGKYCDMPDISALIAPRAQFVESGKEDVQYPLEPAFSMVKRAYELLGEADMLGLDRFDGGHAFHGVHSIPWMIDRLNS